MVRNTMVDRKNQSVSILTSLLFFKNFLSGFHFVEDTTPYGAAGDRECENRRDVEIVKNFKDPQSSIFEWFNKNYKEVNNGKSHLVYVGKTELIAEIDCNELESQN